MKHISILVKNLTSGGAEKQSVLLAKTLVEVYDVHYIIFNGKNIHQKYMDMLKSDSRIHIIPLTGGFFHRFRSFVNYLKQNNINAVFSYLTAANFYACMAGYLTGTDIYTGLRNAELPPLKLMADRFMTNHFAKQAIANSHSGKKNFVAKGFKSKKVTVIPNCFENIAPYSDKAVKKTLHIITVGRFVPQKDYETAIRAIAELKKKSVNRFFFDIVGYGDLEKQIREWIKVYKIEDCTSIHINPDNIPELLDNADIYISTSLFEGTSNSIMEAMNANLPIIATNVGDNNKLVINEMNGFICKVKDYLQISNYIVMLINDTEKRRMFGYKSKEILHSNYNQEIFKQYYINLFE